ncbi:spermidine/putrescine ABC transporter permease [Anaeromicrobium sediminis]|uniref:Spermidine/putrescine ABC transporter permease n=1 Tax=Anaeromicrobium sediminis TaxID=1478221 RepID=A0A267MIG5_9FIRM|nr:spermidine/putrescine ABC transporter permease [Anaeromicrobium sediminis]
MNRKMKIFFMLLPTLLIIGGIFFIGILKGFFISLGYFPEVGLEKFTLYYYKEVIKDKAFIDSLKFSLYTSFWSASIGVLVGVLLAYLLLEKKNKESIDYWLYKIPVIIPHTIGALIIYNIFSQTGILSRILNYLNLIDDYNDFFQLVYDTHGIGIILTYIWKEIPFVVLVVYTVLKGINTKLSEAALNLGASKRQVFFHILLPLAGPSIMGTFIIIFAFSFGSFEVPFLLGPTNPRALPVKAYIEYTNPDLRHRPYSMVINMVLSAISFIFIIMYVKVFKKISKYE